MCLSHQKLAKLLQVMLTVECLVKSSIPYQTMTSLFFTAYKFCCNLLYNYHTRFTINATTGRISTKSDLDREDASSFTVTVTAIDQDPIVAAQRSQAVQVSIAGEV